jgi:hypothetical protein
MPHHLAAVAGLDGEALRSGLLLQAERRVPPRAGENGRREQGEPALPEHGGRPVSAPGSFADAEQSEAAAGQLQHAPGTSHVSLAGRRRLVALAEAMEEGRGKSVGGRRKGRIV